MIKHYEKFRFIDIHKNNEFFVEVNWSKTDKRSNNCKLLKFTFPNNIVSVIKKDDLHSLMFVIGTPSEQLELVPQTVRKVKKQRVMLTLEMTKDVMKGQKIVVPYDYEIPVYQEEVVNHKPTT